MYTCSDCKYSSKYSYNLNRHFIRKHLDKDTPTYQKEIPAHQKEIPIYQKEIPIYQKEIPNKCDKCDKVLANKQSFNRHIKNCKGKINPLECKFCKEIFTMQTNKYRHQLICLSKNRELVVIPDEQTILSSSIVKINTQNNIIVFSPDMEFVKTPEFDRKLKDILRSSMNGDEHLDIKELLSVKENQCIKKTNLRSSTSWETEIDEDVYSKMACNLSDNLNSDILRSKSRECYKKLEAFTDYMADEGYINDTDEKQKELIAQYKNLVKHLKVIVYNLTKINNF